MNIDTSHIIHINKQYKCHSYCDGKLFQTNTGHFSLNTKTNALFFHYDNNMGGMTIGKPPLETGDHSIFEVIEEV